MITHVVAVSKNGVIGKDGKLPWHFSSDLRFFKQLTTGHTVIMGRVTFDSIGKPLPNRQNIVVSRQAHSVPGVEFAPSISEALKLVKDKEIFIIGGASIYKETIGLIDAIYLTHINQVFQGDAVYPGIPAEFKEASRQTLQDDPKIEAILYRRIQP